MYWEEFWECVVTASNFAIEERNAEFKFQFMLHATKKDVNKWHDLPIPFPSEEEDVQTKDISGISQLPANMRGMVYHSDVVKE